MHQHLILRIITKLLIPSIILFAFYVQFHGDYGPGGGFQAGVIFASAFILHGLVFGLDNTQKIINPEFLKLMAALGVLMYAGTGVVSMFLGGEFLNYNVLASTGPKGQHLGIFIVELGVGITVAAIMLTIFYMFADQQEHDETEEDKQKNKNKHKNKDNQ